MKKLPNSELTYMMAYTLFSFPHLTSGYENSRKKNSREGNDKDHRRKQK